MKKSIRSIIALVLVIVSVFSICSTAFAEYANARSLKMRDKASTSGKILYYFEKGESLTVLGTSGDWYKVKNGNGKTGYAKKSLVTTTAYNPSAWDSYYGAYDYGKTNLKIAKFTKVQTDLNKNGVANPKLSVDGICGEKSVKAIKAFQGKYSLTQDGIAGNGTLKKLYNLYH